MIILILGLVTAMTVMAAPKRVKNIHVQSKIAKLNKIEQDIGVDLDVYFSDAEIDNIQNIPDIRARMKSDAKIMRLLLEDWKKGL